MKKCLLTKSKKVNKIKPTKKQMKILKEGWKQMKMDYDTFWGLVSLTEEWMEKETGIEGLEFFQCDNDFVGIGNSSRTIDLIQMEER